MASTQTAPPARLKTRYLEEIRPALIDRFGYSSMMQAPRLQKITVNMGVGMAKTDSKVLRAATEQLATIAGQHPNVRRARKSIAAFKLREGNPVGVAVTLRGDRGYEFLDRLVSIAIPRIRDFRGLNPRSFDGRGNYSLGVREQIIFPEIDYDAIDQVRGMDITITTSAATDPEAFALLHAFGLPFSADRRPRGFDTLDVEGTVEAVPSGSPRAAAPAAPVEAPEAEEPAAGEDAAATDERATEEEAPPAEEAPAAEDAPAAADSPAAESESADEYPQEQEPEAQAEVAEPEVADADAAEPQEAQADDAEPQAQAEPAEGELGGEPAQEEETTQQESSD